MPRLVSTVLLVFGVALVLLGFNTALGFTAIGMLASAAAIVSLLYAGSVWFAPRADRRAASPTGPLSLIVFDRSGRIVSGPAIGQPLASVFPDSLRQEIERRSAAALSGATARFPCTVNGRTILMDALPVRRADGIIVYGMLLSADAAPAAIVASA